MASRKTEGQTAELLTATERKRRKIARSKRYRDQQINIGDQVEPWTTLMGDMGIQTNRDFAELLFDWCSCTHCSAMPTDRECLCCMESEETKREMTDYSKEFSAELGCITEHPGFATVCLDRWVLKVAYRQYKQQYGEVSNKNDQWRYIAYRQYVRWCWGFLWKNVRVILPACVVNKIRTHYPSELYKGFEEA